VFYITQVVPFTCILYSVLYFLYFTSVIVSAGDLTMRSAFFV